MEDLHFSKHALRIEYRAVLAAISDKRRAEAAESLFTALYPKLTGNVLSFASKDDEINLTKLNERLATEGRLLLPRVQGHSLAVYHVRDYPAHLVLSKWYINEPNPALCKEVSPDEIGCILVPALAFDRDGNRLGYGKGHFDRLLAGMEIATYGVGFIEQEYEGTLPTEHHDIAVSTVTLW